MNRLKEIKSRHPITVQFSDDVTWLISEIERKDKALHEIEKVLLDIYNGASKLTTGNISHNVLWLRTIIDSLLKGYIDEALGKKQ